eukprot:CAMPEP_0206831738 /NCGR_PEP_ID=MMETSP0975-20121206/17540_1 /ASSEMBLY_ACC=CAM_ASM_000399 /TAXON_ID=483370 /ORGANISM="non described non described, Strain CCMP2097" /LENGTH=377 /DNA_ID=CAMNT_0054374125 /DNA_START=75 /DNA_END=1204 /DNA_ORIENTATION=+
MDDPPAAAAKKPCCVYDEPGGKHCTKCKSRHYCSKKCQLVNWKEGGRKAQCKQLAAEFQDRMLDVFMPEKLKINEEPAIVDDVAPAAGSRAAARLPAVRTQTTAVVKASAVKDGKSDWRGTCAICLDLLPLNASRKTLYSCCCKTVCTACSDKCKDYDKRSPLCRTPPYKSAAEWLRRMQKHVDEGNAVAQFEVEQAHRRGQVGPEPNFKKAMELFEFAAAQVYVLAQNEIGVFYGNGYGVKIDHKTAVQWYRRAAEQGYPNAQCNLGGMFTTARAWPSLSTKPCGGSASPRRRAGRTRSSTSAGVMCKAAACRWTSTRRCALQARRGQGVRKRCGGSQQSRGAARGALQSTTMIVGSDNRRSHVISQAIDRALLLV